MISRRGFLGRLAGAAAVPFALSFAPTSSPHRATVYLEMADGTRHAWPDVPFVQLTPGNDEHAYGRWGVPDCKVEAHDTFTMVGVSADVPLEPFGLGSTRKSHRFYRFQQPYNITVQRGNTLALTGISWDIM